MVYGASYISEIAIFQTSKLLNILNTEGMENYLLRIIVSLVEDGVDFVVCGGVACVLQGCERTTFDIDIYPRMTEENLDKLIEVFWKLDFHPRIPEPIEHLKELLKDGN